MVAEEQKADLNEVKRRLHRGLPFRGIVFCLGQLCDVERGVAEPDQLATVRQLDWIRELLIPRHRLRRAAG